MNGEVRCPLAAGNLDAKVLTVLTNTICLNMIVKNEMANLERCLSSIAPYIGYWVIGDTGSSDGTQDWIRDFFAGRGIPGELYSFPFENFEQARNEALRRANESPGQFDYILFADADMELQVEDQAFASRLTSEAYQVLQNSGVSYWNTRILRRGAVASYKGVTHEFLNLSEGETRQLEGISYIDHASGGSRGDKYDRDARLLSAALAVERDPGMVARYTFYLANTLRDAGRPEAAIEQYLKRAELGYWQQEVFISLYNVAKLKEELRRPADEVIGAYMKAADACPDRAEALHGASHFCRNNGMHGRGYQFAERGLRIRYPRDGLFVVDWIYKYGLLDEYAVNAYWAGKYSDCEAACERLLSEGNLPAHMRDRVQFNRDVAVAKLEEAIKSETDRFLALLSEARSKDQSAQAPEQVLAAYFAATAVSPSRAEALHGAARFCRNKALYELGYQFAMQGIALARPTAVPTEERWIYDFVLLDELSVNAYWTDRFAECVAACDRLLAERGISAADRERIKKNRQFAVDKLGEAACVQASPGGSAESGAGDVPENDRPSTRTFDLFDTLITRRDPDPHVVFRRVERRSGHTGFAVKRASAEAQILASTYTLADIYVRLITAFDMPAKEAERLIRLELAMEEDVIFPIAENIRRLDPVRDTIVSDMYLSEPDLRRMLRRTCNLTPTRLIVSSDGKRSGRVWRKLLSNSTVIEHLGDNPVTDEASAKAAGIPVRMTTVASRTAIETELADRGYSAIANLMREARLSTWSDDPVYRQAQVDQIEVNFPLLFLSTLHLLRRAREAGWDNILFSARDGFLWSRVYDEVRRRLTIAPAAAYFYTSRIARAQPSESYLEYFTRVRSGKRNVAVDLCGTGWSLSRLIERSPDPQTEIFLLHRIELTHLLETYSRYGALTHPINVDSVIRRGPKSGDNDVLEDLNRALHPMVEDVKRERNWFVPVFSAIDYPQDAIALIRVHHSAFLSACSLIDNIEPAALNEMIDRDATEAIVSVYDRMSEGMIGSLATLLNHKMREESRVLDRLRQTASPVSLL